MKKEAAPWTNKRKEGDETSVDLPKDETQSSKSRYVVSARPGTVNFVETGVEFIRPTKEWETLTEKSKLESGDKLRTSDHSYVELTMLPDINLRIDGESEILLEQLSNESISLKLLRGSAILDVVRFDSKEVPQDRNCGSINVGRRLPTGEITASMSDQTATRSQFVKAKYTFRSAPWAHVEKLPAE